MTSWQLVRIIGGFFILLSLALGVAGSPIYHNANWLWFTAFVGCPLYTSDAADEMQCVDLGGRRFSNFDPYRHMCSTDAGQSLVVFIRCAT